MRQQPQSRALDRSILKCIAYFNVFQHPITATEVYRFLDVEIEFETLERQLSVLASEGVVKQYEIYYGLKDVQRLSTLRVQYEEHAIQHHTIALINGGRILNLPFVSGVCISGSLSKGVMKKDADIDYFIIGKHGRVWLAKFFIKTYKYLFLNNSKEYFCTNYFISDQDLIIKEKNLYTATELATLIPLDSDQHYSNLLESNLWWRSYFPNYTIETSRLSIQSKGLKSKSQFVIRIERLLSGYIGSAINKGIMKLAVLRNRLFYNKQQSHKDFELMFRSTLSEIKVHGSNHQMNTLEAHQQSTEALITSLEQD